jgi:hypothetical protein
VRRAAHPLCAKCKRRRCLLHSFNLIRNVSRQVSAAKSCFFFFWRVKWNLVCLIGYSPSV